MIVSIRRLPEVLADQGASHASPDKFVFKRNCRRAREVEDPRVEVVTRYTAWEPAYTFQTSKKISKLPVEIMVRDNGPGIPEEIKDELFSPFVTTKPEGQGLGLALAKKADSGHERPNPLRTIERSQI